jgi:hypothetical protein
MPSESDDLADFKKRHGAAWLAFGMARAPGLTTWNRNRVISGRGQFRGDDRGRTDGRAARLARSGRPSKSEPVERERVLHVPAGTLAGFTPPCRSYYIRK